MRICALQCNCFREEIAYLLLTSNQVTTYEPHRKLLGLQWEVKGKPQFFMFTVLPFGLATACYTFTKILRPLVKYWCSRGLRVLLYLDEEIVAV